MKKRIIVILCTGVVLIGSISAFQVNAMISRGAVIKTDHRKMKKPLAIKEGRIVNGEEAWQEFKIKSQNAQPAQIKILETIEGEIFISILKYDGSEYTYYREDEILPIKKKHLIEVTGKMPSAAFGDRLAVLADKDTYTYDDITRSIYSSNSADHINYETIFWIEK